QRIGVIVNKNPLPLLLTSAGLIWLAAASRASGTHKEHFDRASTVPRGDFDASSEGATSPSFSTQPSDDSSMRRTVKGKAGELKDRAHRTLDATRERATRTWG